MEECPAYDNTFTDLGMLFAHYSSGQPYSQAMDFTDPHIRIQAQDAFRLCRVRGRGPDCRFRRVAFAARSEAERDLCARTVIVVVVVMVAMGTMTRRMMMEDDDEGD